MKIVFLDFDGVLNTASYQQQLRERGLSTNDAFGPRFDPNAVSVLGKILESVPEARVVVSSTWKDIHGLSGLRRMWRLRGLPGTVDAITPTLFHEDLLLADLDNTGAFALMEGACKGKEIAAWLTENKARSAQYVIIDDADGFPEEQREHHVKTAQDVGLTDADAERAIAILNR